MTMVIAGITGALGSLGCGFIVKSFHKNPYNAVGMVVFALTIILSVVYGSLGVVGNVGLAVFGFLGLDALFGALSKVWKEHPVHMYSIVGLIIAVSTFLI